MSKILVIAEHAEGKLSGIFFVGPKATGQPLFQEEIELCRALADQLAARPDVLDLEQRGQVVPLGRRQRRGQRQGAQGRRRHLGPTGALGRVHGRYPWEGDDAHRGSSLRLVRRVQAAPARTTSLARRRGRTATPK